MILWFAGGSLAVVWSVFHDPAIDYRFVVGGALLPDVFDAPFGGARYGHTLLVAAGALALVMIATRGRRAVRRRLLFVPIGMLLHLVLDGLWTKKELFWWPAFGASLAGHRLPFLEHGWFVTGIEEVAGAAALLWWREQVRAA